MNFRLTDRDIDSLMSIFKYRYLTADQLTILHFPSLKKTSERLKYLIGNQYLNRFEKPCTGAGRAEYVYHLTIMGARIVADFLKMALGDLNWQNNGYRADISHFLNINSFRIALEKACLENKEYSFEFIPEYQMLKGNGKKLKKHIKDTVADKQGKTLSLIPDSVFCLQKDNKKALFMLEIDNSGTMGHTILKAKWFGYSISLDTQRYNRYSDEFNFNFAGFRVLVVTVNPNRLENIIQGAIEAQALDFIWGTTFDKIKPETIFTPIWRIARPDDNDLYSIVNSKDIVKGK